MGIHSSNNLLDTIPLGHGLQYYKHRQEACSPLSFISLAWWLEFGSQPQCPQSRGMYQFSDVSDHQKSFATFYYGLLWTCGPLLCPMWPESSPRDCGPLLIAQQLTEKR